MTTQPKRPTFAQTFQCAFAVYERELYPLEPTPDSIVRLSIACDKMVQFSIDKGLAVTFCFSDGSQAVVSPRWLTAH